jgi:hypothetical protein
MIMKDKYYTADDDFNTVEIDEGIAKEVIRQYFERRYVGALVIGSFIIGFLLGVIAYAI